MRTLTHRVVAMRAAAIRAVAHRTRVRTVWAATGGAFVVVHALVGAMLAVHVAIVQVVNMVGVEHRFVSTPGAMGVRVVLSLSVLDRGHGASLSGGPSHAYMRSFECQGLGWATQGSAAAEARPKTASLYPSDQRRTGLV